MDDWDTGADDAEAWAVMKAVVRQLKLWREAAGLTQAEFGVAIGYGEELVSSVERGRRIPRPEYLDRADEVLGAGGKISALTEDVAEVRYPKKVRDLKKLEAESVELCAYNNSVIHGLLQTAEYARAVIGNRQPPFPENEVERRVAGRLDRQGIINSATGLPVVSFVQCEATLRRCIGGTMVLRRQLERLLEVGQLPNVTIQVLPLRREDNSGLEGPFRLLKLKNGTTLGHLEVQHLSRVISDARELQILELRYGMIRAQALTPRESRAFIEKVRGET
ncbi:helix-turn-helix domain-containing protein [Streptomyces decoyicus]|uniref:helix-turn-helix domain-containing protein n=1 Tax=Streptomyces decoyicus TaxID=249567 RepID=UPI0004AB9653|nr:helix-turn-helix transcriptional regulator [Streptomyces decoyicus]KOG41603.1 DNA-binding protein [Streptomyces decoyicus]QZY16800.1 helix-turn-helix transcriptional regulator [Streptomyces decoyicus]